MSGPLAFLPAGVQQALSGGVIAGAFLLLGKGADWLVKRNAERIGARKTENDDRREAQGAEDGHLEAILDRYRDLAAVERARADQIAGERDVTVRGLETRINALAAELDRMKAAIGEKDALIADQAAKIGRLERRVQQLERHNQGSHD